MNACRRAIAKMLEDTDTGLECANAVAKFARWSIRDEEARKRLMQCVRGTAGRHFELDWYPIVLRVVVFHGGDDLVAPIAAEAVYEARRQRREADELAELDAMREDGRKQPRRVPAEAAAGRRRGAA